MQLCVWTGSFRALPSQQRTDAGIAPYYTKGIPNTWKPLRKKVRIVWKVGVVRWYGKDAAMTVGFEEACAVIVCMPAVSILSVGSMLCSVNGEDINSPKILLHILDMHQTAGDTFEVTVRLPKQEPVTKTITVPESDEGFAGYVHIQLTNN